MIFRPGRDTDIPSIIELLKISLGENLIPKSENLWKWKHESNPFGKSPLLIAEENGMIVGVRAFLRWDFLEKGKTIKACRAVDTATHPDYQGIGIFKNLTLALIEELKLEGYEVIFNTPNTKSTQGYLKMGWEKWGKLPLKLSFHLNKTPKSKIENSDWNLVSGLIEKIESKGQPDYGLQTKLISGFLNWRYRDNPLFAYQYLTDSISYLLIYRIKEGKMGTEFRICDLYTLNELSNAQKKELQNSLNHMIKISGARFSSFSGLKYSTQKIIDLGYLPVMNIGPIVTLRQIQDTFLPFNQNWNWSLGDLEVF